MALLPFCAAKLRQFFELTKFFLKFFSFSPFFLVFHRFFLVQSCFSAVSIGFSLLFSWLLMASCNYPKTLHCFPAAFQRLYIVFPGLPLASRDYPTAFHRFPMASRNSQRPSIVFPWASCFPAVPIAFLVAFRGSRCFRGCSPVPAAGRGYVHYGGVCHFSLGCRRGGGFGILRPACLRCTGAAAVLERVGRFAPMASAPRLGVGGFAGRGIRRAFYI